MSELDRLAKVAEAAKILGVSSSLPANKAITVSELNTQINEAFDSYYASQFFILRFDKTYQFMGVSIFNTKDEEYSLSNNFHPGAIVVEPRSHIQLTVDMQSGKSMNLPPVCFYLINGQNGYQVGSTISGGQLINFNWAFIVI